MSDKTVSRGGGARQRPALWTLMALGMLIVCASSSDVQAPAETPDTGVVGLELPLPVNTTEVLEELKEVDIAALLPARAKNNNVGGYLFVTFRGEQTDLTEQIYFGLSRDGRTWSALNGGEPVLVSHLGERGVRDPYLLRSHDGKRFYLLATDLSMYRGGGYTGPNWMRAIFRGSRAIIVWESTDLVHWSHPRRVEIAPPEAGCTWAPEAVHDPSTGDYLVFWASKTGAPPKFRIYAARTKDFSTFGKPFVYMEQPYNIIDTTILQENGRFYRFTKNEDAKLIIMESSASLSGPWEPVPGFTLSKLFGHEGPLAFQLAPPSGGRPGTWMLLLDFYSAKMGYQPYVTNDLASGQFFRTNGTSFPFPFRHGTVLPLSEEEFDRLSRSYPVPSVRIADLEPAAEQTAA